MIRQEIKKIIKKAAGIEAKIEYPLNSEFGDYTTNAAMTAKLKPEDLVAKINSFLDSGVESLIEKPKGRNGFINFFLKKEYLQKQVKEILKQGSAFGRVYPSNLSKAKFRRVNIEFISANPTGPLTLGNGRGGFCGDVLANVLEKAGFEVKKEYYINDRGEQIKKLGHSVIGDNQAVYKGDYIDNIRKELNSFLKSERSLTPSRVEKTGGMAAKIILREMLKPTIKKMNIKFDKWFSEKKELYDSGKVSEVLEELKNKGFAYEKDGALWFKSTDKQFKSIGDDKDRVLVKADGQKTYLASDAAYIKNKFSRGFDKLIYFLGADHYGYIKRMQALVEALGYKKEQTEFIVMQMVRLVKKGREVKMSKREGVYVTLDELIDEIGLDAVRFFFLARGHNSHLNFDLDLAKEQSQKNPVYYVQYAHARICSILREAKKQTGSEWDAWPILNHLKLLVQQSELNLVKQLIKLPEIIEDTAQDYQLQRLPKYAMDLAAAFHKFYTDCRVIDKTNSKITQARLAIVNASQIVLKNVLDTMGINAPKKM